MPLFDLAVLLILFLSALLGWWRGFVYELFSLLGWAVAYIVARNFSAQIIPYVPQTIAVESIRSAVAFAAVFLAVLILSAIFAWALSRLIKVAGLSALDSKLGMLFGLVRGIFVVLALVWLGGLTSLPQQSWWKDAWTSKPLQQAVQSMQAYAAANIMSK